MQDNDSNEIVFALKDELSSLTPDVWSLIEKKIAAEIAHNLLQQLSGVPSPEGKLITEMRDEIIDEMNKIQINKIGA